jgi:hypothetical protein
MASFYCTERWITLVRLNLIPFTFVHPGTAGAAAGGVKLLTPTARLAGMDLLT